MSSNFVPLSHALQQRLDANVELKVFLTEAEALIQAHPLTGFGECSGLLEAACRNGAFTTFLNYELNRLLCDPNYALEGSSDVEVLVLRSHLFNLKLRIVGPTAQTNRLIGHASDMVITPLNLNGITMTYYKEPISTNADNLDRSGHLQLLGNALLPFGRSSYFKAGRDIFAIPNEDASIRLLACLSANATLTTRWEYDATTGARIRAVAADHSVSRLQLLASVLAEMRDPKAVTALEGLMEHPAHYVRWAALQAVFCLDRRHGVSLLHKATNDAHQHVRSAAVRSLTKLNISMDNAGS
jgi:hypothetical protein